MAYKVYKLTSPSNQELFLNLWKKRVKRIKSVSRTFVIVVEEKRKPLADSIGSMLDDSLFFCYGSVRLFFL